MSGSPVNVLGVEVDPCDRDGLFAGVADLPVLSLALGLLGAMAIVCIAALLAQSDVADCLRYCGKH